MSSGVGSWRRHPDARWTVTAQRDTRAGRAAVAKASHVASHGVRPGGTLVYTVATVTRSETTAVVQAFLAAHPIFNSSRFRIPLEEGATGGMLQIWPQTQDGEARFIARMVRRASTQIKRPERMLGARRRDREHRVVRQCGDRMLESPRNE